MKPRSIFRWFAPPRLQQLPLRRRARALWVVSWLVFAVATIVLGLGVLVEPDTLARRAVTIALVGALTILPHIVSRSGRPLLACWIFVIGLTLIVTQRAWITGGIFAPVSVFYALFIVLGGLLIGARGGLVTAALCFIGAVALTAGTAAHMLAVPPNSGSPYAALVFVVLAIGLAVAMQALVTVRPRSDALSPDSVTMLVHDMRSPMQVLLAHLELLRSNARDETLDDVESAIKGARMLNRMTTRLLDLGRLEAGKMPLQKSLTNLQALASEVADGMRILQPSRFISVKASGDPYSFCDPELTRRVIENLLSNAMKHTPLDGRVDVAVTGSFDKVRVDVSDDGAGVPPEKRPFIFDAYSADGLLSTTGYESSGLGLAFSKLAIEAQGGAIRVDDAEGGGALFTFELSR